MHYFYNYYIALSWVLLELMSNCKWFCLICWVSECAHQNNCQLPAIAMFIDIGKIESLPFVVNCRDVHGKRSNESSLIKQMGICSQVQTSNGYIGWVSVSGTCRRFRHLASCRDVGLSASSSGCCSSFLSTGTQSIHSAVICPTALPSQRVLLLCLHF